MTRIQRKQPAKKSAAKSPSGDTLSPIACSLPTSPLIDGESEAEFQSFQEACRADILPVGAIEEVWFRDYVDFAWNANRFGRMKVGLIQSARRGAIEDLLFEFGKELFPNTQSYTACSHIAKELSQSWSCGGKDSVEAVNAILVDNDLNIDAIMAKAVATKIDDLESIDKLISTYITRRDAALRELEKRRAILAKHLNEMAISDADFVEVQAAE